ncbi:PAS domain S-box protein [Stieleria sp. TO1_6]|uniref:PAS domain S-box protein n=1 Tax=Stieleria tagensis TaxID=2956795 RepID=UPI00209AFD91|nr:PAS domain S-box protein [Stieleria tagensis]MCO8121676.1 PAS domain S-box protein [Stieleria tagensis]
MNEPESNKIAPPLIVGVGASAGGLEAFQAFLNALGSASELAIVFVQHMDRAGQSLLAELLSAATTLDVVEVVDSIQVRSGCVYVGPPQQPLELSAGVLRPITNESDRRPSSPIDTFFHSLAEDQGESAVGVILSGAGTDGTLGLKAISDAGGLTFAQDSKSAKFDSMPRSAATTGVADHVMEPAEIAAELKRYCRHLLALNHELSPVRLHERIEEAIPTIAETLLSVTGHNFQHYKNSTLRRRIQRRMQILKVASVAEYVNDLQRHDDEAQALFRELLIGVTMFFRDPEAFAALRKEVLPKLFEQRNADDSIRIWVAGCANGAEAYSLAILCREFMDEIESPPEVQIFATDIDERALQIAREGIYPVGIQENISEKRLQRFFVKRGNRYQVTKEIRDLVLFSAHNLISDPPFSRQDLICCRNLLIYLGPHLQKKLVPLFHYALRPSGFLFLGPSESMTSHGELFRSVDAKSRISQRKGTAVGTTPALGQRPTPVTSNGNNNGSSTPISEHPVDLTAMRQRILLDEFAPKSCVIDESGKVLNAAADMQKFLTLGDGDFQNHVVKMVASELRIGLRAAISEAVKTKRRVQHDNLSLRQGDQIQRVMLTVQPMPRLGEDEALYMVVFHELGTPIGRDEISHPALQNSSEAESIIAQLELELSSTREDLDRTMQDMEAANEEMKSSNEELLSMNEELQSANEELEASKEEIRASSDAVARAHSDLQNLLRSTQIATVFLDEDRNIRSFTPAITDIYGLISTDIGRPLDHFVPLVDQMPKLPEPSELDDGQSVEHTVTARSGKSYIRRVLPYRSGTGAIEGIVVTFTEVTQLRESEELFQLLVAASAQIVWIANADGTVSLDSPSWRAFTGQTVAQWIGEGWLDAIHPEDRQLTREKWRAAVESNGPFSVQYRLKHHSGEYRWTQVRAVAQYKRDGTVKRWVGMNTDINVQKRWELELTDRESHLRRVINNQLGLVGVIDRDGILVEVDDRSMEIARANREDVIGKHFAETSWWTYDPAVADQMRDAMQRAFAGEVVRYDVSLFAHGDEGVMIDFMIAPVKDADGNVEYLIPSGVDIRDRYRAEKELLANQHRVRMALKAGGMAAWEWTEQKSYWETGLFELLGIPETEHPSSELFFECVHPDDRKMLQTRWQRAIHGQDDYQSEFRICRPDGQVRWLSAVGSLVRDASGAVVRMYGLNWDITDQKEYEQRIRASEERLRLALSAAELQLWQWNVIEDQWYWSDERLTKTASSPVRLLGGFADFLKRVHRHERGQVKAAIHTSLERGDPFRAEYRVLRGGTYRWVLSLAHISIQDEDSPMQMVGVELDITDRKESEELIRQSLQRVESSNAKLQGLFDVTAIFAGVLDLDGYVQEANETSTTACGYRREQVIGKVFWECPWWSGSETVRRRVREAHLAAKSGETVDLQLDYWLVDGSKRLLQLRVAPARNESGEVVYTVPSGVDVTEQKQREREVRLSEQRLRVAAKAAGFGMLHVDLRNSRVTFSSELNRIVGYPADHEFGLSPDQTPPFVHPDDVADYEDHGRQALLSDDESMPPLDHRIVRPDGQIRWVRLQTKTLFGTDKQGNTRPRQIIGTMLDITAQHEFEESLKAARAEAVAANQSKSAFVANMSHEIRTPMTAILGYTDLIADRIDDEEAIGHLRTIRRNGDFLLEIINDILDLSKIEAGKFDVNPERFDPTRLVEDVRSIMEVRASENDLTLDVHYDGKIPAEIESDPKRLKQILINLVGNAIKFTKHGNVKVVVRHLVGRNGQSCGSDDPALQFDIIDTGIGMSDEQQQKLFKPFSQGDSSVSRHFGGTGLGLAISRRLSEMLGGKIEVESSVGEGSRFTATVATGDIEGVDLVEPRPVIEPSADERPREPIKLDCHVLVVDDRHDIRFLSGRILGKAGATVAEAEDGQIAVDHIREALQNGNPPALILLDMQMPNLDGYDTAKQLRTLGFTGPIIALTADAMQGDMNRCIESGCNDYLSKPIDAMRLVSLVSELTTQAKMV